MGWFDEQVKQRIKADNDDFSDAFASLADTIMHREFTGALDDNEVQAQNAVNEILRYYHVKTVEIPENLHGINERLEYIMQSTGIMKRNVRLDGEWYREATGAMITLRKENSAPVALIPRGTTGYSFLDEKTGKHVKITSMNAGLLADEAICFYKPLPLGSINLKDLRKYIFGTISVNDVIAFCTAALAAAVVGLLIPRINELIYTDIIGKNDNISLLAIFVFLLSVSVSILFIKTVQNILAEKIAGRMSNSVHSALMMRLLSLPISFFKKKSSGELASIIAQAGSSVSVLINAILTMGITAVFSLVYIFQMVQYGKGMVIPGLLIVLFIVLYSVICAVFEMREETKAVRAEAHESGISYSMISGIQKIKLSGAEKRAFAKWAAAYKPLSEIRHNPPFIIKMSEFVSTCIPLVGTIVIYFFAAKTFVRPAEYFAFSAAYGLVMGAFSSLVNVFRLYAQIKPALDAVSPMLETEPEISRMKTTNFHLSGGIEMNNVSFQYTDDMPLVLDNLSLKILPGQYVAIVGESGCGKSTLMRLLLGFEKPGRGTIYYDGRDITHLDLKSLRRKIGTVLQNERLFQGDIFSNIVISAPELTPDNAWKAAEMAGIADDIREMPMGMHTIITEGGGSISGGQRQRIIIARAIASNPKILIFDEATSALDNITQKIVSDSLARLKCTRIVIAHRLSTIKACDRIVVLSGGKIIEDGTYEELNGKNGFFAELVKRQQID